jgi:predicted HTH transcriptional regulator
LANTDGGIVLVGIDDKKTGRDKFSPCLHRGLTPDWFVQRVQDHTIPPVECTATCIDSLLSEIVGIEGCNAVAIDVPKSKHVSGHMTIKGISKKRIGKECKPYYLSEDDRTNVIVPSLTMQDLSLTSIRWAIEQHHRHFKTPKQQWQEPIDYLSESRLIHVTTDETPRIMLAALILFGKEASLQRVMPFFGTILTTDLGTERFRRNVIESVKDICGGDISIARQMCPGIPLETVRELVVNAYVHRCYRTPSPVMLTFRGAEIVVESPGELPAGLSTDNLIHCVPVYRNLLMADAARFFGICDMVGKGFDIAFKLTVSGGFDFPLFESTSNRFTARLALERDERFREFVRERSQALSELDEVLVLRWLWSRGTATLQELATAMQRGQEMSRRILKSMQVKQVIEAIDVDGRAFRLAPNVHRDIETVFERRQGWLFDKA